MRPEDPPQRESEKAEGRWLARKKLAGFPARVLLRSRSFPDRRSKGSFAPRIVSSTTAPRRLPISSTESLAIAAGACATFYAALITSHSPDRLSFPGASAGHQNYLRNLPLLTGVPTIAAYALPGTIILSRRQNCPRRHASSE